MTPPIPGEHSSLLPHLGPEVPELINATIMFVDLMNSVSLSSSMTFHEYDKMIDDFQMTMNDELNQEREQLEVTECHIGGDQLCVFFYDPSEVDVNRRVLGRREKDETCDAPEAERVSINQVRERFAFDALRLAIRIKNRWITHPMNIERIVKFQPYLDLGIGINSGKVILRERHDGKVRIEGFAINLAKRVEGFARSGHYSRIMASKGFYDLIRNQVFMHMMLKQRLFFARHVPEPGILKGLPQNTSVYELKFFHRLRGLNIGEESVAAYERSFLADPTNLWFYTLLIEYYLYREKDYEKSRHIAETALNCNPANEKIYFDLANVSEKMGDADRAREYCRLALRLNHELDLAYEVLADLEPNDKGGLEKRVELCTKALAVAPGSPSNMFNLANALFVVGRAEEARRHMRDALAIYPGYSKRDPDVASLAEKLGLAASA